MTSLESNNQSRTPCSKWCRHGPRVWCVKYFWEGQLHRNTTDEDGEIIEIRDNLFKMSHVERKLAGFILPALVFNIAWLAIMASNSYWYMFKDGYPMSITMIFGSIIGGMTSEAGGAIAFPVMTLVLKISPVIARDFSLMIQSCGLSAAAFTISFMHVKVEMNSLIFCSTGGAAGLIFGLYVIDSNLTAPQKKMGFVSIWFSFAFALYLLNRNNKRRTFLAIPNIKLWKICILILTGFIGGCFSSFAGSGIDICSFSILCLLFRVSEKVATPTSVVLMAVNTCVGFFWRGLVMQEIEWKTYEYLLVCIPIVVVGAPLGSLLGTHFHRLTLACIIYVIDIVALVGAFAIVPQTPVLTGVSCAIIVGFFIFFLVLTKLGAKLLEKDLTALRKKEYVCEETEENKVSENNVENHKPKINGHPENPNGKVCNVYDNASFKTTL